MPLLSAGHTTYCTTLFMGEDSVIFVGRILTSLLLMVRKSEEVKPTELQSKNQTIVHQGVEVTVTAGFKKCLKNVKKTYHSLNQRLSQ